MATTTPIILEFGSHSLKVHYQSHTSGIFRKGRYPWDLGHEVYSRGKISRKTAKKALETITLLRKKGIEPSSVMAIATGAMRDAENCGTFLRLLEEKLGLRVRVISGREEASLLAQGYLVKSRSLPAMICDIGGGSLEVVYLGEDRTILRDSLPLGAIRVYHFGIGADGQFDQDLVDRWIEDSFAEASVITADEIHCTGGTAKALAKTTGKKTVTRDELADLVLRVRREGPPATLKPDRARVFLPGLMVLSKLVEHSSATRLHYLKVPVGRIFMQKCARQFPAKGTAERRNFLMQDLRITQIYPHESSAGIRLDKRADGD
ncbi:MAG: hypothetical protein O7J95_04605 [Planctomycetota bacterium]|nr:hypothetical protein [Planctomycetota bacterium]